MCSEYTFCVDPYTGVHGTRIVVNNGQIPLNEKEGVLGASLLTSTVFHLYYSLSMSKFLPSFLLQVGIRANT